jgi:hypothetical protein
MKIVRGKQSSPARVVIYGTEGIGKSTLASQFPDPVVLDTEDGTRHLDVARVAIGDWKELTLAVAELAVNPQGFKTVVVDSADWAEKLLIESMLKDSGKKSIEDYGYGKGYTVLQEHVARFLHSCDKLIAAGLHVVFVAHAKVQRTSPPDQTDGYDRYELKLTKQVAPLFKEWADAVLFANYRLKLVEGNDGRMKARGGKERIVYAERSAAWDAKNRYGLPEEMPMGIEHLAPLFAGGTAPITKQRSGWLDRVADAQTVAALGEIADDADQAVSAGDMTESQRNRLDVEIAKRHSQIEPAADLEHSEADA